MTGRIITSDACVAEGMAWLCDNDPIMAAAYAQTGALPLRLKDDGFGALMVAIVSQQVSVASANAIWAKMENAGLISENAVAAAGEDDLRAVGLSRQKIRYGLALAHARIDYPALRDAPTDTVIKILTAVPGIGTWTAEIYAMFSLGRADIFACGDLALQEAARVLYALPDRPKERAMREMALQWAPWQSVAARLLWAYYKIEKQRDGIR
ncbi:MAG: DNA-3-methyladenine glycosylase 2 family protein [Rhodobacterales bacterium]|nr:DNA-3-methyladenine glycosylase 2 family protein [Rhodobacterales bacterium]